MPDREKVKKALEYCDNSEDCRGCVYWEETLHINDCPVNRYALELLKEQEAVEPKKESDGNTDGWASWWYVCGNCGVVIDCHDMYCRHCGRAVKWD